MRLVSDIETLRPFFCVTFLDYDSDQYWQFKISGTVNQLTELKEFMRLYLKYMIKLSCGDVFLALQSSYL